ncbi:MAG: glycosyl hydrolase family 18 protein [Patescibacteria group bacterium]
MKKEFKISIAVFALGMFLLCAVVIFKNNSSKGVVSPFASNSSIFSLFLKKHDKPRKIIYGYLPWWSIENIKYLQIDKLTHIAYFGLYLEADGSFSETTIGEDGSTINEPGFRNWKNSKELKNLISKCNQEDVRVALTVISHIDKTNDAFLNCRECWDTLLVNLKKELDDKGIKDVNLNFEHAEGTDDGISEKFAELTKFLNEELDKIYGDSFLVVSAFGDSTTQSRVSSDLDNLGRYTDGIFIMAYDYHRPESETIGPVSPMEGNGSNVTTTVTDFLTKVPPSKIILGVPYYGYNWLVEDTDRYAVRVPGSDENGFSQSQSYESVMETIIEVEPELKWDDLGKVPYFTYISPETGQLRTAFFENAESLKYKYDLVNNNNLGGVGIWALGYDGGYSELWDLLYTEFIK